MGNRILHAIYEIRVYIIFLTAKITPTVRFINRHLFNALIEFLLIYCNTRIAYLQSVEGLITDGRPFIMKLAEIEGLQEIVTILHNVANKEI